MKLHEEPVLIANGITKSFKGKCVIKNASFSIKKNSIVGLVGKNGAGKTTLMRILIGFLKADSGSVCIDGVVRKNNTKTSGIGYLTDVPVFYEYMTCFEYLSMCAGLLGIENSRIGSEVDRFLKLVNLENSKDKKIKGYSRGMKQRLGIAQCLIGNPKLIICDEPMSALDPIGREEMVDIFNNIKQDTSILLSTHIISDVEKLCDEVIILKDGNLTKIDSLDEVEKFSNKSKILEIDFTGCKKDIIDNFELIIKNKKITYERIYKKFRINNLSDQIIADICGIFCNGNAMLMFPRSINIIDKEIDEFF